MSSILENCGPCGNVLCSQYGCQHEWGRSMPHPFQMPKPPFYWPMTPTPDGAQVFNAQQEIAELKRRVSELEKKAQESSDDQ